jgi:DNA-binding transcriptional LysR family regulator
MPHVLPYLESGALVRVLPDWYTERGEISLYFAAKKQLPAKTRVFIDFVVDRFRTRHLAERWSAC